MPIRPGKMARRQADRIKRHIEHFGAHRRLASIRPGDADTWREEMLKRFSQATVSREVKRAMQFFRAAVRMRIIPQNPFEYLTVEKGRITDACLAHIGRLHYLKHLGLSNVDLTDQGLTHSPIAGTIGPLGVCGVEEIPGAQQNFSRP